VVASPLHDLGLEHRLVLLLRAPHLAELLQGERQVAACGECHRVALAERGREAAAAAHAKRQAGRSRRRRQTTHAKKQGMRVSMCVLLLEKKATSERASGGRTCGAQTQEREQGGEA